jgi:uncharacterized alpha-E superfamily protein
MLSRVANRLYWMARYIERAENSARLVNVNTHLQLDLPRKVRFGWGPLIEITGSEDLFAELYDEASERSVIRFLVSDERNPGSILSSLRDARENTRTVRDIIPREAWEQLNDLYLYTKSNAQASQSQSRRYNYLKTIILGAQQITGLLAGTMSHDYGYDFIRLGRNLERADMGTRILDVRSASLLPDQSEELRPFDYIQWVSVLKSMSAYQMYRQHMQVPVRRPVVLQFLLQDRQFPRAFYHCVCEVENCLKSLPRSDSPVRTVTRLQRMVTEAKPYDLEQAELHRFVDELQLALAELHMEIHKTYFESETLAPTEPEPETGSTPTTA